MNSILELPIVLAILAILLHAVAKPMACEISHLASQSSFDVYEKLMDYLEIIRKSSNPQIPILDNPSTTNGSLSLPVLRVMNDGSLEIFFIKI